MKIRAAIRDIGVDVEVRREGAKVFATIDGRKYQIEAHALASGMTLRSSGGRVFDCRVEGLPTSGKPLDVFVGANRYVVTLIDPKRLRGAGATNAATDGAIRIVAPMPGKVVRILAEAGASVEAGTGILVVEAMKMQNEMKSPKAGTVTALNVDLGATVNGGDVLAVIE